MIFNLIQNIRQFFNFLFYYNLLLIFDLFSFNFLINITLNRIIT